MSAKQKAKHITDNAAEILTPEGSSLDAAEPTPDGLGAWEGGKASLKSPTFGLRTKSLRTADAKNAPGKDYKSKITHRQDRDFNEIHVEETEGVLLYNVHTDTWDIKGDIDDLPYYVDGDGLTWAYDAETGRWDVFVEYVGVDLASPEELTDVNPEVSQ